MSPGHSSLGTAARPPETITSGTRSLEVATIVKVRQRARSVHALIVSRITGAVARCSRSQWKFRADIRALLAAGVHVKRGHDVEQPNVIGPLIALIAVQWVHL